MNKVEILVKAKELVEKKWCQEHYRNYGAVCAVGALQEASGMMNLGQGHELYKFVNDVKQRLYPKFKNPHHIESWNDQCGRRQEEVVCLFQKAIERAIEEL